MNLEEQFINDCYIPEFLLHSDNDSHVAKENEPPHTVKSKLLYLKCLV